VAERHFRAGDRVRFHFGAGKVTGLVKEDRGPIGLGGRHLFLIQFPFDDEYPSFVELPGEDLELVSPNKGAS
jgi:hypothetical protein